MNIIYKSVYSLLILTNLILCDIIKLSKKFGGRKYE